MWQMVLNVYTLYRIFKRLNGYQTWFYYFKTKYIPKIQIGEC